MFNKRLQLQNPFQLFFLYFLYYFAEFFFWCCFWFFFSIYFVKCFYLIFIFFVGTLCCITFCFTATFNCNFSCSNAKRRKFLFQFSGVVNKKWKGEREKRKERNQNKKQNTFCHSNHVETVFNNAPNTHTKICKGHNCNNNCNSK